MAYTTLIRGASGELDRGLNPSADLLASRRLLHAVAANPDLGTVVRLYRPAATVAFSGRESTMPGFADAVGEAMAFGFEPVIRPAGGRMVALDENWLVLDVIAPESTRATAHKDVFLANGQKFVDLLQRLGVAASLGSVAGEYCPGDYSINARGRVKIVGTAQRVTRGARLFSASIPMHISPSVAELFTRVNRILGLDWDARTLGALDRETPGLRPETLEAAILNSFAPRVDEEATLADLFDAESKALALG